MSAREMMNDPVTVKVSDRSFTVEKLSVLRMTALTADYITEEAEKRIQITAGLLPAKERTDYIVKAAADIPLGHDMEKAVQMLLSSGELSNALAATLVRAAITKGAKGMTDEALAEFLGEAKAEETTELFGAVVGKARSPHSPKSNDSRKRTDGRRK